MKSKKENSKTAILMIALTLMTVHMQWIKRRLQRWLRAPAPSTVTLKRPWPNSTRTRRVQKRWPTKPWPC